MIHATIPARYRTRAAHNLALAIGFFGIAVLASSVHAAGPGSLLTIFIDMEDATLDTVKAKATEQATADNPGQLGTGKRPKYLTNALEERVFEGVFIPGADAASDRKVALAVLSDDGCDTYINGQKVHAKKGIGQNLRDVDGQSFHHSIRPTDAPFVAGTVYTIRVEYTNIIHNTGWDVDGCSLFAYNGGGLAPKLDVYAKGGGPTNPYGTGTLVQNLLGIWPGDPIVLEARLTPPPPAPLPANFITWNASSLPNPPANTFSNTFTRSNTGVETITIAVPSLSLSKRVHIAYPDVGTLSERYGLFCLDPQLFATSGFYGLGAQAYATNLMADGMPADDANAIQHAYWNSLIASDSAYTTADAILATTAHEYSNRWTDGGLAFDSVSDLHNNYVGAFIVHEVPGGIDVGKIKSDLKAKLVAGELWRIDSSGCQIEKTNGTPIFAP